MRALFFDGVKAEMRPAHPEPRMEAGQAIIRPLLAGICSTDLEICRGYMGFTGVLGHEFVGVVEAADKESGDRGKKLVGKIVVGAINCVCGQCDLCKCGLSNHCPNRTVLGIQGRDGCFAERFTLPVKNLLEVPGGVTPEQAVFAEPLAAACNVAQQLRVEGKPYITVLGDGRLGLLTAQVLAKLNASVRLLGRHDDKLALCEKWGIKHRRVEEVVPRADQDVVVDCTGSAQGLATALKMVRPRGKVVLKTTVADQKGVDLSPLVINEVELIGSRCGPMPEALRLLAEGAVDVISMISRRVKFDAQAAAALATAARKDVVKVLFEFE